MSDQATMPTRIYAKAAEKHILGTLLVNVGNPEMWAAAKDVDPVQLYMERHRILLGVMFALEQKAIKAREWPPFDVATLGQHLETAGLLERVGGWTELTTLMNCTTPFPSVFRQHVRAVVEASEVRRVMAACDAARDAVADATTEAHADVMAKARLDLVRATEAHGSSEVQWLSDLVPDAFAEIGAPVKSRQPLKTGIFGADTRVKPQRGDLMIIAARPSMGKTAAMLQMARGLASDGHRVLIDIREMQAHRMVERLLTSESGHSIRALKDDVLSHVMGPDEWDRQMTDVAWAAERLYSLPIGFLWQPGTTVEDICQSARRAKARHGIDVLMIDYLQLIRISRGMMGEAGWAHITRELKQLACELDIFVALLSQLNRQVEMRPNKRPLLSDLKNSGAAEADADQVLLLYRPIYYTAKEAGRDESSYPDDQRRAAEWGWAKLRDGSPGTDHMLWFGERQRFETKAQGFRSDEAWAGGKGAND